MISDAGAGTLLRQGVGFLIAGAINTVASYACYLLLLGSLGHQVAYAIAYVFGIAVSYLLNARFVFRAKPRTTHRVAFAAVYLAQWALGALLLEVLVVHGGISNRIAPLLVLLVTVPVSFVLVRRVLTGSWHRGGARPAAR